MLRRYMMPLLTISQIYGKSGVPTTKLGKGKASFGLGATGIEILSYQDDPVVQLDLPNSRLHMSPSRQPYVPVAVYKCLTKMAIAIMPPEELPFFANAIRWIMSDHDGQRRPPHEPLLVWHTFIPGPRPIDGMRAILLKRVSDCHRVPYMMFVVAFGNMMFQIIVPSLEKDRLLRGQEISFRCFPGPCFGLWPYGEAQQHLLDLSSSEVVRDEVVGITIQAAVDHTPGTPSKKVSEICREIRGKFSTCPFPHRFRSRLNLTMMPGTPGMPFIVGQLPLADSA